MSWNHLLWGPISLPVVCMPFCLYAALENYSIEYHQICNHISSKPLQINLNEFQKGFVNQSSFWRQKFPKTSSFIWTKNGFNGFFLSEIALTGFVCNVVVTESL